MSINSVPKIAEVSYQRSAHLSDDIDFVIRGAEMQYVDIKLEPGEAAIAEAGSLMHKDAAIEMTTLFGDGSDGDTGLLHKLWGAGKRVVSGVGMFTTLFSHQGQDGQAHVAFAAPFPGHIIALRLDQVGGELICQRDAFLCAARGVSLDVFLQRKIMTGIFGGDGFILQRLHGDGWVFVHVGGSVEERELAPGEVLDVDAGCVAAFTSSVDFDLARVGNVKSMLFSREGFFFARMTGPGKVWIQSLPFSRLAARIGVVTAAMQSKEAATEDIAGVVTRSIIQNIGR